MFFLGKGLTTWSLSPRSITSVYAFDADSNAGTNGGLLWQTNLGTSALSNNHEFGDRYNGGNYTDIVPEVGITGTPVINLALGTLTGMSHARRSDCRKIL